MMRTLLLTVTVAGLSLGCSAASSPAPTPTPQTGPDADVSIDGLHRVDNSVMGVAYMKPDMDLRGYTSLMLDPVSVAYKKDPQGRRTSGVASGNLANFELTSRQMSNLKTWFRESVIEALTKDDGYPIVETPGPGVLRVTADLLDLVVKIPTENAGMRSQTFTTSFGEVTLVIEARDSQTGEILARAGDRQDPTRRMGRDLQVASTPFVRGDTKRLFADWADLMRERLDQLREIERDSMR